MADVFLNLAAILCGLVFSIAADPPIHLTLSLREGSRRRIARFAALVLLVFAMFFDTVHLGYRIADDELGSFVSRYAKPQLERLETEKRELWRVHPLPLDLHRVSREDQYMSEGVIHVQKRNEAWTAGDAVTAWRENQILEKYYAPVLDTPSYVSRTGFRWPTEQRADAEARAPATAGADYVSRAYPYPIFTWPLPLFWGIAGTAIGILVGLSSRR
jgi:hypothetical protein